MKISNHDRMLERLIDQFDKKIDGGKGRMKIFDMTKEDFEKVPKRGGYSKDIGSFSALVISPQH